MLFHAAKVVKDRFGQPVREPKPGEKPKIDEATKKPIPFDDDQMRSVTHGDVAILALDSNLHGDEDAMTKNPAEWVRQVMRREKISSAIAESALSGDGWVELESTQKDILFERLAMCVTRHNLSTIGPVMDTLENPPREKPSREDGKIRVNGHADPAAASANDAASAQ